MKRFFSIFLSLTCLMAVFCPAFAAVECRVPQDLPGVLEDVAVHDVLMIGGAPENQASPESPVQDVPADGVVSGQPVDGKYATMGDLYQAWGGYEGYPDYVCGVWSTDGGMTNMTVAVTEDEAGEKGKEEILSLLENTNTVTFTYQRYSYKRLQSVMNVIVEKMGGDSPIIACGIYEMENVVRVTMDSENRAANAMTAALTGAYGDKIRVEQGSMILTDTAGARKQGSFGIMLALAAAIIFMGLVFAFKLPARLTNTGKVVTETKPTRTQVEATVRASAEMPPDRVEAAIRKQL